ncbi:Cation/H(+) antiporter like [Actinidia chinensis var. chinensis]|uniref:Cation/H(+) antiporter like n=1 Tax=Actinidia chinensis var. chinensis TaxID=1590841 RepID=A0A2R6RWN6_ACTCC|nr:Cation/H(+) antiporter like [Actinidia chinensis var. chinensis]
MKLGFILGPTILGRLIPVFSKTMLPPEVIGLSASPTGELHGRLDLNACRPISDCHTKPKPISGRCLPPRRPQDHHLRTRTPCLGNHVDPGAILLIDIDHHHLIKSWEPGHCLGEPPSHHYVPDFDFRVRFHGTESVFVDRQTVPEGKSVNETHIVFIASSIIVSDIASDNLGILYHYGPFLLDLFVVEGPPPLGSTLEEKLDNVVSGWFAPLLLTYFGLHSDLFGFTGHSLPAWICKIPFKDALALSLILSAQGIVELGGYLSFGEVMQAKKRISSQSQQIIKLFNHMEDQHPGTITTQFFTSISLSKFMHEDICSLSFEKLASLIILPFHRKWNSQGKVVFHNGSWRTINHHVLQMAPCSIGILVDRPKIQPPPSLSATKPSYSMAGSWEAMLDAEVLKDLRLGFLQTGNMSIREEKVDDGADLALKIHVMKEGHDLIIVGRCHGTNSGLLSGLTEWVEFPELGPVGDILADNKKYFHLI